MKKKIKVLFFNFNSDSIFRIKILEKIQIDYDVCVTDTKNQKEAITYLTKNPRTIFVFNADTIGEYMQSRTILAQFKDFYKSQLYSIGVLANVNPDISSTLKKLGCKKIFNNQANPLDVAKSIHGAFEKGPAPYKVKVKEYHLPKSNLAIEVKSGNSEDRLICNLDSLEANSLLVELQGLGSYNPGDKLKLNVVFEYENCKVDITLNGVIEHIEKTDFPETSMLNMNLSCEESLTLENFMVLYQKKQDSIDEFMTLAKGVA